MIDLNRLVKQEKELVWAILLVCLALMLWGWYFLTAGESSPSEIHSRKAWHYEERFSAEDLAFLQSSPLDEGAADHSPFYCGDAGLPAEKPPVKKVAPPVRKTQPVQPAVPAALPQPVPETVPLRQPEAVVRTPSIPQAGPRLEGRLVQYTFYRRNQNGQAVAIVRMMDRSRKIKVLTLCSGQKIDGLTVKSISEERVQIQDAGGRPVTLRYKQPVRLAVQAGAEN